MSKATREGVADWLMLLGAPLLGGSLFLTWSHQFSRGFAARHAATTAVAGIPRDPTAWQVYSVVDVLLAVLALGLLAAALRGARPARIATLLGLIVALAFTVHALGSPPIKGAERFAPAIGAARPEHPTAGPGELVALAGIGLGLLGVLVSFTAD